MFSLLRKCVQVVRKVISEMNTYPHYILSNAAQLSKD